MARNGSMLKELYSTRDAILQSLRAVDSALKLYDPDLHEQPDKLEGVDVRDVLSRISGMTGIPAPLITGRHRAPRTVDARHQAIYVLRELTALTLKEIGDALGGLDHTTVGSAYARIRDDVRLQIVPLTIINQIESESLR